MWVGVCMLVLTCSRHLRSGMATVAHFYDKPASSLQKPERGASSTCERSRRCRTASNMGGGTSFRIPPGFEPKLSAPSGHHPGWPVVVLAHDGPPLWSRPHALGTGWLKASHKGQCQMSVLGAPE